MDEEDYSRYFTDEAELSNYNAPAPSDYSRYFTDEAEQSNYNTSAPSYQNYDYSRFFNDESGINQNTQFPDRMGGATPANLPDTDRRDQDNADYIAMLRGNQTIPGNDQSFGFLPPQGLNQAEKDAIAREEASPGGTAMNRVDKNALTSGISAAYKALQQANKKAGPDQMSKKDALSMLMPLLLAMIAKNQGGSSGRSPAQEATQPKIPTLTASREMTPYAAPGEKGYTRPGAGGKTYFSDVTYKAAGGGIGDLGGYSDGGRLLKGPGDGVSDSIPAKIGQDRPARLSDGEFVIPARIVSELGNGSTEAGAKKLYAMMDRVKKARNHKNIAANTKADKHLPA
jgi:hypothetical protein